MSSHAGTYSELGLRQPGGPPSRSKVRTCTSRGAAMSAFVNIPLSPGKAVATLRVIHRQRPSLFSGTVPQRSWLRCRGRARRSFSSRRQTTFASR